MCKTQKHHLFVLKTPLTGSFIYTRGICLCLCTKISYRWLFVWFQAQLMSY